MNLVPTVGWVGHGEHVACLTAAPGTLPRDPVLWPSVECSPLPLASTLMPPPLPWDLSALSPLGSIPVTKEMMS